MKVNPMSQIRVQTMVFYFCLFSFPRLTLGQVQLFESVEFTEPDGLLSSHVYDINQDDDGKIWFATRKGVCMFDGYSWQTLGIDLGPSDYEFLYFDKDDDGKIWTLAFDGKIVIFQHSHGKTRTFDNLILKDQEARHISSFIIRGSGEKIQAWVGTRRDFVQFWDSTGWRKVSVSGGSAGEITGDTANISPKVQVFGLAEWKGKVWAATNEGLFDVSHGEAVRFEDFALPGTEIFGLKPGLDGRQLWLHGGSWFGYLDEMGFHHVTTPPLLVGGDIRRVRIQPYPTGDVLISNYLSTLCYSQWGPTSLNASIREIGAFSLFLDREANIWMATSRGAFKLRQNVFSRISLFHQREVSAIEEASPGKIVFGHNAGISIIEGEKKKTIRFNQNMGLQNSNTRIMEMAKGKDGEVWFAASRNGLGRLLPSGEIDWFDDRNGLQLPVISVQVDSKGQVFALSSQGPILKKKGRAFEPCFPDLPNMAKRRLVITPDQNFMILCPTEGVFQHLNGEWVHYKSANKKAANNVYSALESSDGTLLVGTLAGLYWVKNGTYQPVPSLSGWNNNHSVYLLLRGGSDELWLGTDVGLVRLEKKDSRTFLLNQGLPGLELNRGAGILASDGSLFFGCDAGAMVYNPGYEKIEQQLPPPILEIQPAPSRQDQAQGFSSNPSLEANNNLHWTFKGVSFIFPNGLQYQARLSGYDEEWNGPFTFFQNELRYFNLPPGTYQLEVQARNPGFDWSSSKISEKVVIEKPFWATSWFLLALGFTFCILLAFIVFHFFRIRYTRRLEQEIERKTHELKQSQSAYTELFENSPMGIYRSTPDGRVLFANPALLAMLGLQSSDQLGVYDLKKTSAYYEDQNSRDIFMATLNKEGEVSGWETTWIRHDGSLVHIRENARSFFDETGKVLYYEGTVEDISEQLIVRKELQEEKEQLWTTLATLNEAVITTNPKGKVRVINPSAEELLGKSRDQVLNRPISECLPTKTLDHPGTFVDYSLSVLKGEVETLTLECSLVPAGKAAIPIALSIRSILDNEGKGKGCVVVFRNISREKKLEETRTKAQKLESLGLLAGGIAHDFNNMLTSILGNIHLANLEGVLPSVRKKLNASEEAILKAKGLTQQLLTFSQGGKPIKELCDLKALISQAVWFSSSGSSSHVSLTAEEDQYPVFCDSGQMTQVASNLTINAIQAMPSNGELKVSLKFCEESPKRPFLSKDCKYVEIAFQDNGHGIEATNLSRVFDPYYTTREKGSGLGLASTYSILKQHDGFIQVESEPGFGTTFFVFLPASDLKLERVEAREPVLSGGRVLLLDDDEMVLEVGISILEALHYETVGTKSGEETCEIFKRSLEQGKPFDLVILDLTIPGGMGGKETMKRLKEIDPGIKGVVSSGYSNDDVMANPKNYGFEGVLAKPYSLHKLKSTLHSVMHLDKHPRG